MSLGVVSPETLGEDWRLASLSLNPYSSSSFPPSPCLSVLPSSRHTACPAGSGKWLRKTVSNTFQDSPWWHRKVGGHGEGGNWQEEDAKLPGRDKREGKYLSVWVFLCMHAYMEVERAVSLPVHGDMSVLVRGMTCSTLISFCSVKFLKDRIRMGLQYMYYVRLRVRKKKPHIKSNKAFWASLKIYDLLKTCNILHIGALTVTYIQYRVPHCEARWSVRMSECLSVSVCMSMYVPLYVCAWVFVKER